VQVRAEDDELAIFEPYHYPVEPNSQLFTNNLRWRKVSAVQPSASLSSSLDDRNSESRPQLLRSVVDFGGLSVAVLQHNPVRVIMKESTSVVRSIQLAGGEIQSLASINAEICPHGLLAVTSSV